MRAKPKDVDLLHRQLEASVASRATSPGELAGIFDRFSNITRAELHHVDRRRMFRDLPTRFPRLSGRVDSVRNEGRRLDAELDALSRQAMSLECADSLTLQAFRARTRALIADLRRLDLDETELLQTAYWRVNGAGD
jgi:hypothetical protein